MLPSFADRKVRNSCWQLDLNWYLVIWASSFCAGDGENKYWFFLRHWLCKGNITCSTQIFITVVKYLDTLLIRKKAVYLPQAFGGSIPKLVSPIDLSSGDNSTSTLFCSVPWVSTLNNSLNYTSIWGSCAKNPIMPRSYVWLQIRNVHGHHGHRSILFMRSFIHLVTLLRCLDYADTWVNMAVCFFR